MPMSKRLRPLTAPNAEVSKVELAVFDFDGVLTDNTVYISAKGDEYVRCFRGDGLGLRRLEGVGVRPYVLSTEVDKVVELRCRKLNVEFKQGLANKAEALSQLAQKLKVPLSRVMYLGNDINDRECLEIAGVSVVVADAFDEVAKIAKYQTLRPGGLGAVREVCDWIALCKKTQ